MACVHVKIENGVKKKNMLGKCSGKTAFSKYLWFQNNVLEFSKCQILGQLVEQYERRKRGGGEAEFHERIRKE